MKKKQSLRARLAPLALAEREGYASELIPKKAASLSRDVLRDIQTMSLRQNTY